MAVRKLTLGSLFNGLGGWIIAGEKYGVKTLWESEVEKYCEALMRVRFPDVIQLGDVTKIDGAKIPPVDIICSGSPCFVAGTMVHTMYGVKPIEDIVEDWDLVLSEDGEYHHVEEVMCHESDDIYELKAQGMLRTEVTGNHPVLVKHMKRYFPQLGNGKRGNYRRFSEPEWVEVKDLKKGDFVGYPIIKEEHNAENITEEEAWLIGRYIADGYINNRQRAGRPQGQLNHKVIFCIGKSKLNDFISKVTTYHVCPKEDRTAYKCEIISERLMKLCMECGCGAENKEIPYKYLVLPNNLLKALITGYLDGDGCYQKLKNSYCATTISKKLALSLQLGIHKTMRTPCKLYFNKRPPTCVIEGRTVNQRDTYMVSWKTYIPKQSQAIVDDNYIWQPIRSITKISKSEKVYNLEVSKVHSYCANGIVVHNCQSLSVAGKREGLKGESGLFFYTTDIIRRMREATGGKYPRFLVWENVPGALNSSGGNDFRAVLEAIAETEIPMPPNNKWAYAGLVQCDRCEIAWRCMDAQYWGVPQRRNRVWLVADFAESDRRAKEILFVEPSSCRNNPQGEGTQKGIAGSTADSVGDAITLRERAGKPGGGKGPLLAINKSGPLMANTNDQVLFESHPNDSRVTGPVGVAPTISARYGTGGGNTPIILNDQGGGVMNVQSDDKVGTLRAEAHGNNPIVLESNQNHATVTDDGVCPTLPAAMGMGGGHIPSIVFEPGVATRDGGHIYTDDKAPTLRANPGDNFPTITCSAGFKAEQGSTARGLGYKEEQAPTLTGNTPTVVYGICSKDSNSMKSGNPHSGIYETEVSRTLDTGGANPNRNQGGNVVVYALEGNGSRPSHQGKGYSDSGKMYTLNTIEQHAVAQPINTDTKKQTWATGKGSFLTNFTEDVSPTLMATDWKEPPVVVTEDQDETDNNG